MWKAMTTEEQKPYQDKYIAKKEKYEKEMKEYINKRAEAVAQARQEETTNASKFNLIRFLHTPMKLIAANKCVGFGFQAWQMDGQMVVSSTEKSN